MSYTRIICLHAVLYISINSSAAEQTHFKPETQIEPYLATKAPYPVPSTSYQVPLQQGCELVHINHLGRHGSRHISKLQDFKEDIVQIADALGLPMKKSDPLPSDLTPLGKTLTRRIQALNESYEENPELLGSITIPGFIEQEGLGFRLFENTNLRPDQAWNQIRRRGVVALSTSVSRTQASRSAFLQGLASASGHDRSQLNADIQTPAATEIDRTLHFYDHCQNYIDEKAGRKKLAKTLKKQFLETIKATEITDQFGQHFLTGRSSEDYSKLGDLIYGLCRLDANLQYALSVCPLISATGNDGFHFLKLVHKTANIKQFSKRGPSGPNNPDNPTDTKKPSDKNTLNQDMAVDLLRDFLSTTQAAIDKPSYPIANLRFAHDATVLRMMQILNQITYKTAYSVKQGVLFDTSKLAPMSANLTWQTYRCPIPAEPDQWEYKVRYFHNERLGHFPTPNCWGGSDPDKDDGLCPWSEVRDYYQAKVDRFSLEQVCGGLNPAEDTDD